MHWQDRTPGSILESNTFGFLSLYLEIPFQHWRLKYAAYFTGAPGKRSSSATCIFTATFEPKIQDSSDTSGHPCGSSPTLDGAFYFTFIWTSWKKHTDILFASWVYLKQRYGMVQPRSLFNLDAVTAMESDFVHLSMWEGHSEDHRRDCVQAGPCVGYESFDHPQQEQILQLNQQKQWLGQVRLGHADMEANS